MKSNKRFKFGQSVYLPIAQIGNFELVKGVIDGVRRCPTAFDEFIYEVNTPRGMCLAFGIDLYESVEDFIKDVPNLVIE